MFTVQVLPSVIHYSSRAIERWLRCIRTGLVAAGPAGIRGQQMTVAGAARVGGILREICRIWRSLPGGRLGAELWCFAAASV